MRAVTLAAIVLAGSAVLAQAHEHHAPDRQAAAHVHGAAILNIAIEGAVLTMEFAVPAADIVGFEHAPRTDAEHTDITQARAALADPFQLIAFPVGAGCRVESVRVDHVLDLDEHDGHGDDHDHGAAGHDDGHVEFVAFYRLDCADPMRLTGLTFPVFDLYPSIIRLRVQAISQSGQRGFDVVPDRPEISLRDLTP